MGQFLFDTNSKNTMEPIHLRRFGILLSLLILGVSSSTAGTNGATRCPTCNYNTTSSTLQGIVKSSMQDVLSDFFTADILNNLRPNSESDANRNQIESDNETNLFGGCGCPLGWFRILDSCLWVPPRGTRLNYNDAYMFCKRKIPGGKLFEPLSKIHNDYAKDLVDAIDGVTYPNRIWIGINDHREEGRYVYTKSDEPILFENWLQGQPDNYTTENCIVHAGSSKLWRDIECTDRYRFICEKYLA